MNNFLNSVLIVLVLVNTSLCSAHKNVVFDDKVCGSVPDFNEQLKNQIKSLSNDAQKIIDFVVKGSDKGVTYQELAKFVDKFGHRLAGSETLENSIDYMVDLLKKEGHNNVHTEEALVPTWVRINKITKNNETSIQTRGREWAQMIAPRTKPMNIMGLGGSVGTNGNVLTGDVLVVKDFDDLKRRANEVKGKFVVYNYEFQNYDQDVVYRRHGATMAAKYGATAALIRSAASFSIDSPHTGWMSMLILSYNDSTFPAIPGIAITVEDSQLFQRITSRGENVRVSFYMEANNGNNVISRNTISEIAGTKFPDQTVLVSGHLDSWDVGQGAMDNGGGAFISWRALSVIKKLGLQPKRTLRAILWTGEEFGLFGSKHYAYKHSSELNKLSIAMESDSGTFTPSGLSFTGVNPTAQCIVNEFLKSLDSINASRLTLSDEGTDISNLMAYGVPGISLDTDNKKYFEFHHTNGDTMTALNTDQLDLCTAVYAVSSYLFAALDQLLPR